MGSWALGPMGPSEGQETKFRFVFGPTFAHTNQARAKPAPSRHQTCAWPTRNALQSFAHTNRTRPNPHSNPLVFEEASSEMLTFMLIQAIWYKISKSPRRSKMSPLPSGILTFAPRSKIPRSQCTAEGALGFIY